MDFCQTLTKKKKKNQMIQTEAYDSDALNSLREKLDNLKLKLSSEVKKADRLNRKCDNLKKKNELLQSELQITEDDFEKSWASTQEKLKKLKIEFPAGDKNSNAIKNVYLQLLKKNSRLARSNFTLQAEMKRLQKKVDKQKPGDVPTIKSSPELRNGQVKEGEEKTLPRRRRSTVGSRESSSSEDVPSNLIISGSLISVPIRGKSGKLRPVFLVLEQPESMRLDWRQLGVGLEDAGRQGASEEDRSESSRVEAHSSSRVEAHSSSRVEAHSSSRLVAHSSSLTMLSKETMPKSCDLLSQEDQSATLHLDELSKAKPLERISTDTSSIVECVTHSPSVQ